MKISLTPIDKVVPYGRNPRKNQAAIAKVAGSIKEFGWQQPIVTDSEMVVIAGHTRLEAARYLGLKKVPVYIAADLTQVQAKAYRLADNKLHEEAEWDHELLQLELGELKNEDFNIGLTGFSLADISPELLDREVGINDPAEEWVDMPEFDQQDKTAFRTLIIHFKNEEVLNDFLKVTDQKITEKTRFLWYPKIEIDRMSDKQYVSDE